MQQNSEKLSIFVSCGFTCHTSTFLFMVIINSRMKDKVIGMIMVQESSSYNRWLAR